MAKRGPNRRSDWHQTARLMRMKGYSNRDIAIQVGVSLEQAKVVCRGIKPRDVTGKVQTALFDKFGIRVMQVEKVTWDIKGGQPYRVKISLPFISMLGEVAA